jgi:hypothetical protein
MKNRGFSFLSAFALASAAAYGCGSEVQGSGSTGSGGSATSASSGDALDGGLASSSGVGGAGTGGQGGVTSVTATSSTGSTGAGVGGGTPGCTPTNGAVLAVTKLYYGDTNFDGSSDKVNAWKQFGFNIDGKVSTASSLDLCKPQNNASPNTVYPDGNAGIDNSFGRNILPLFMGISSNFSGKANQSITSGHYTLLLDLEGLGVAANQAPLVSKVYSGTPLSAPPKFDGSDCWPVAPEGLTSAADITSAKVVFPMGAVAANHWDSGPTGAPLQLKINVEGFDLDLDILGAHVTMDLDPDHQGAQKGQIGGVIATSQLVAAFKKLAGRFDSSLCNGATLDSIVSQLQQASDILVNGTQDPSKNCDAISIGLGFEAQAVSLGGIGPAVQPQPDPCAP